MINDIIERLKKNRILQKNELIALLECPAPDTAYLMENAIDVKKKIYGNDIYIRGLIEISSYCRNDCFYCGIRRSNKKAERYRLELDDVLRCADKGYVLGFRTFVLQGGEDAYYTDDVLCKIVSLLKEKHGDCAVTLSLGERSAASYMRLKSAGADRYLLRHETANPVHYSRLHPRSMSYENRMQCLDALKKTGFQTGCGFMVGTPYQTIENIAEDLIFISQFKPHMVGIGPFIPHKETPFRNFERGSVDLTVKCLAIVRLMLPDVLLPATTALGTASSDGRQRGILAGANVIMPNLSPSDVRCKYNLYDNKLYTGIESAEEIERLAKTMEEIGCRIVYSRGDHISSSDNTLER